MPTFRHGLNAVIGTALVVISSGPHVWAQDAPTSGSKVVERVDEAAIPAAEDVTKVIDELKTIRDYERLYWILHAAEQHSPQTRAELLQRLDDRVQSLIRGEVELRTASTVESLGLFGASPQTGMAITRPPTNQVSATQTNSAQQARIFKDVSKEIEQTNFTSDPTASAEQLRNLMSAILSVPDPNERQKLSQRLQERAMKVLQ